MEQYEYFKWRTWRRNNGIWLPLVKQREEYFGKRMCLWIWALCKLCLSVRCKHTHPRAWQNPHERACRRLAEPHLGVQTCGVATGGVRKVTFKCISFSSSWTLNHVHVLTIQTSLKMFLIKICALPLQHLVRQERSIIPAAEEIVCRKRQKWELLHSF